MSWLFFPYTLTQAESRADVFWYDVFTVTRCLCARNYANFGDTDMAANPFEDGAGAGVNHWMGNMKGITLIQPA